MKKYIQGCLALLLCVTLARAQEGYTDYNDRVRKYVEQYYPLAIAEQKSTGIPASITLGQGILETDAGASDLMTLANNHFGIKCTHDWMGETITHDDETADECFKKYRCAADSYKDHSDHLKTNPRYKALFGLSPTDYAAWAVCLKRCGYATNPQYAERLIKIIEDFKLQEYTYSAMDSVNPNNYPVIAEVVKKAHPSGDAMQTGDTSSMGAVPVATAYQLPTAPATPPTPATPLTTTAPPATTTAPGSNTITPTDTIAQSAVYPGQTVATGNADNDKVALINGMRAFYVNKDESLLPYAVKYHTRYPRLLEMNDLPDAPAPFNMYVYLEKKLTYGIRENHKVANGETVLMISQEEGMQLKKIMALNLLNPNEEPVPGSILELQKPALQKPEVKIMETIAHKEDAIVTPGAADPRPASDYIATTKPTNPEMPSQNRTGDTIAKTTAVALTADKTAAKNGEITKQGTAKKKKTAQEEMDETLKEIENRVHNDSLAALKTDLDKEVYASDSKPDTQKTNDQQAPKYTLDQPSKPAETTGDYITIHKGETLFSIAVKHHVTVEQLLKWNNVQANKVKYGEKLRVTDPGRDAYADEPGTKNEGAGDGNKYYVIHKGETLFAIAKKNNVTVDQLMQWNNIESGKIKSGQKLKVSE